MLDEHILQYIKPGDEGETDLIIGLDFGTSSSKVVIQAPYLAGRPAYAVDFGPFASASLPYLLPTRIWIAPDGTCSLDEAGVSPAEGAALVTDIKLRLFTTSDELKLTNESLQESRDAEAVAVAYLALLLRYVRKWFLESKRDVVAQFTQFYWSLNLGVPSPFTDESAENLRFRRVGEAAWMLSVFEEVVTLSKAEAQLKHNANGLSESEISHLSCAFNIVPEIVAGAVGYAASDHRREGVHLIIDIGASTVDICSVLLWARDHGDQYSLLTSDVRHFGTRRLQHQRLEVLKLMQPDRVAEFERIWEEHDPMQPLVDVDENIDPSDEESLALMEEAEGKLKERIYRVLRQKIMDLRRTRAPGEPVWKDRLPILVIGGGSQLHFYHSLVDGINEWLLKYEYNEGAYAIPVRVPHAIQSETCEHHRLVVAWGLSHDEDRFHSIRGTARISNIPPPPRRRPSYNYIGPEQT